MQEGKLSLAQQCFLATHYILIMTTIDVDDANENNDSG